LEGRFLNDFLPDLGVTRNANASSGILYARKTVTKNGLQNWLVAINTASTETVGDVGMTMDRAPTSVWDSLTGSPVEFTYSDGWVWIKNVKFPPYGTRIFGCQRASLSSGLDVWWLEKTKFWTRRVAVKPDSGAVPTEAAPSSTRVFDSWRFLADKDGSVGAGAAWNLPGYDDRSWRSADNTPWNLQFDDLKDYAGVALYRSAPFDLPASWRGKTITVNLDGQLRYCWTSFELSINGQPVPQLIRSRLKVDVTSLLKNTGNVLCIKMTGKSVDGDFPLSGLAGTGVWLEREVTLQPMMSLLGPWQAVHPGWTTSSPVEIVGAPQSLTDDGRIKPGVAAVVSNHFVRDVEIPESWRGRNVYVHIVTPQMSNNTPPVGGLGRGMLLVNGEAKLIDQRPNVAVNEMINVTAMLKFGASNRLELWGQNAGPFTEGGTVINDLAIGCEAM
jgi:hypothetical protein